MRTLPWRHVHFTGIGGVGMTGLALILRDFGVQVSGTDETDSKNLKLLAGRGATVVVGHAAGQVGRPDVLVYSSAVPPDNPERLQAAAQGLPQLRRGDFLAELAMAFPRRVSCAGSHGKTTVTAMLSHLLIENGWEPGYLVGGHVVGRQYPAAAGCGEILVTEVDESDGTQARMQSTHAIVTNVEDDHVWSLGGMEQLQECFREFARHTGCLVATDLPETRALFAGHPDLTLVPEKTVPPDLRLLVPGPHNRLNATLAVTMAAKLGLAEDTAWRTILTYPGAERRQSVRFAAAGLTVIEDYAHHPSEVRATLAALREVYPKSRLRVVFQPHRYERIARFADGFSRELAKADLVTVVPPFAAWVNDADRADPRTIVSGIRGTPATYDERPYPELARALAADRRTGDLFVVLGAGSVTALVPMLVSELQKGN